MKGLTLTVKKDGPSPESHQLSESVRVCHPSGKPRNRDYQFCGTKLLKTKQPKKNFNKKFKKTEFREIQVSNVLEIKIGKNKPHKNLGPKILEKIIPTQKSFGE